MQLTQFRGIGVGLKIALLTGLFALAVAVSPTYAGRSVCRADPIVYLTNGTVITMMTDFDIYADQIKKIEYTVHAPRGSVVDHIVYDVGNLGVKEKVVFYADQQPGQYEIDQYARTYDPANVTAINTIGHITQSMAGHQDQHLTVRINQ
jgi:hypothetical protein